MQPTPPKKQAVAPDLYPDITEYTLDDSLAKVLRQNGQNPTRLQEELNQAIHSGDTAKKAGLLERYTGLTDKVLGNNAASGYLRAHRRILETEHQSAQGSVSGGQAFWGLTGNGLVDLAESLPKLAVAAYQSVKPGNTDNDWKAANQSVENFFAPLRTYVSNDYQQGLASYDSETGLDLHIDAKSMIGTAGSLFSYVLPGLLTAGGGTLAGLGARAGLRTAATAAEQALNAAKLGKIGKGVSRLTGISSFLQTFPSYQKEALDAGLNIRHATLFAIPVAGVNAFIETANVGALTKALGLSDDAAKQAIRAVTTQEVQTALQGIAGKALTADAFLDAAEGAAKNALGRISRPEEMSLVSKWVGAAGRRIGRGFKEQGFTEGGEEFLQSIVENASKQIYNNFGAATGATEGNGKFKDPTLGDYVFNGAYGTIIGGFLGGGMGIVAQTRQLDPTIFGYVGADTRLSLSKGIPFEELIGNEQRPGTLKIWNILEKARSDGSINEREYADVKSKVVQMSQVARDFQDVEGLGERDKYAMFTIAKGRSDIERDSADINALKDQYTQVEQTLNSGQVVNEGSQPTPISPSDRLKLELTRNALQKKLGPLVSSETETPVFEAEKATVEKTTAYENIVQQVLGEYANDTDRDQIKSFLNNNLSVWRKQYDQIGQYDDTFTPEQTLIDPDTGQTLAYDGSQKFFRVVQPTGGEVTQAAAIDGNTGRYVAAIRKPQTFDYSQPVNNINQHLGLSQALADPASAVAQSVQSFEPADNSNEANLLRDGQDLVNQLNTDQQSGRTSKRVQATKDMASAYLDASSFLSQDQRYGSAYEEIVNQLRPLVEATTNTSAQQTTPAGSQTTPVADQTTPATQQTTQDNGQTEPISAPVDLAEAEPATPTIEPDYVSQFELNQLLDATSSAEGELESALDAAESADGIPSAGTIEQLIDALERTIAATREAIGDTGTNAGEQSADESDTPTAGSGDTLSPVTLTPNATLRAVWPSLTDEQRIEATSLAQQYLEGYDGGNLSAVENAIYTSLPRIRDLKEGFRRFHDANTFTASIAKSYQARADDNSAPRLDQFTVVLQETMPSATEQDVIDFMLKFPKGKSAAKTYGLRSITEQFTTITGKTLNSLVARRVNDWSQSEQQPATNQLQDIDGVEFFDESALDIGTELLFNLSSEDATALEVLHQQYIEQHGKSWLTALYEDLEVSFPPVSNSLEKRLEQLTNGENSEAYERVRESLENQFGYSQQNTAGNVESQSGELEARGETGGVADSIGDGSEAATSRDQSTIDSGYNSSIGSGPIVDESEQAIAALESAVAALESESVDGPAEQPVAEFTSDPVVETATPIVADPMPDDEYRAFRADASGYQLSDERKAAIGRRMAENRADTRDQIVYQNRKADIDPFYVAAKQAITAERNQAKGTVLADPVVLRQEIDELISREASQDPVVGPQVAALDIELANLSLQQRQLLTDVAAADLSESDADIAEALDDIDGQRQTLLSEKADAVDAIVQTVSAAPEPVATNLTPEEQRIADIRARKKANSVAMAALMRNKLNTGIDPELLRLGLENMALSVELGVVQFRALVRDFMSDLGTSSLDNDQLNTLKMAYGGYRTSVPKEMRQKMDTDDQLDELTLDEILRDEPVVAMAEEVVNPDAPRFQLIGKSGLRNWLETDPDAALEVYDNRDIAEQMERAGRKPEAIFAATGWSREVASGKWQYELEDLSLSEEAKQTITTEVGAIINNKRKSKAFTLLELSGKAPLFDLYPDLADYAIEFRHLPRTDIFAGKINDEPRIIVNLSNERVRGILEQSAPVRNDSAGLPRTGEGFEVIEAKVIHELQHSVQSAEGFGNGGDVTLFNSLPATEEELSRFVNRFNARLKKAGSESERSFLANQQFLARQILEKGLWGISPYQLYRRLAGELYAHAVEYRATRRRRLAADGNSPAQIRDAMRALPPLATPTDLTSNGRPEIDPSEVLRLFTGSQGSLEGSVDVPANPASSALVEQIQRAFPGVEVISSPEAYDQALQQSGAKALLGDRTPLGFRWQNKVYLSPEATENTVLHEFGGVWVQVAKTQYPEQYRQGIDLMRNSSYLARIKADPYYSTLSEAEQLDEALETAIGDEGVGFLEPAERMSFGEWLAELWNQLKTALGLASNPSKMTLNEFVGQVVGQLTGGASIVASDQIDSAPSQGEQPTTDRTLPNETQNIGPENSLSVPQFQLSQPAFMTSARTLDQMRQDAENRLNNIPVLSIGAGVDPDLWDLPKVDRSSADQAYVDTIEKETGWRLSAPQTLIYNRPTDQFHLADGSAVRVEGYELAPVLEAGFGAAHSDKTNRGKAFRFMIKNMQSLVNFDTFVGWLDDASGTISTLLKELKRQAQRRASYANVVLQPLRIQVEKAMVPFSKDSAGSSAKTLTVKTYDYDENGVVYQREMDLPVAVAMELVSVSKSQLASFSESSIIADTQPTKEQLYRENADGSRTRRPKGAAYFDEETNQTHYVLLDQSSFNELLDRFENGNGAWDGEQDAFKALGEFYNRPEIANLLAEENGYLNPDKPFNPVSYYHPTQNYNVGNNAQRASRGAAVTLEESRILVSREKPGDAVLLRDPIKTMGVYQNAMVDILAYGRLVQNLVSLSNGISSDYSGPEKDNILNYLKKRIDDFQNHRANRARTYQDKAHLRGFETLLRRYTQSVFSWNVGLPLKQTGTYSSAYGQGIIGNEFLRSSEAAEVLAKLTFGAYKNWSAESTVNIETGGGLAGPTGNDTLERPYLEVLFGESDLFPDQLAKDRQRKRFATVLDRLTTSQTTYTGDIELRDITKGKTLDKGQKALAKLDEFTSEYGMAAMLRADRAVLLAFVEAAKQQAFSEGLSQDTDAYWDRVADLSERTMYMTNQMSFISEQTQMQASTDFFSKILGMYSGQQQKLVNQIMTALTDWIKAVPGTIESDQAWKRLAHAFTWSVLFNSLWVATVSAGVSALMAILSGDEPKSWEESTESIGWGFVHNVAGSVPGLSSMALDFWISKYDNIQGNEDMLDVTALQTVQRGIEALDSAAQIYINREDPEKRQKSLDSMVFSATEFMAKATGTPSSITRIAREYVTTDDDDRAK